MQILGYIPTYALHALKSFYKINTKDTKLCTKICTKSQVTTHITISDNIHSKSSTATRDFV